MKSIAVMVFILAMLGGCDVSFNNNNNNNTPNVTATDPGTPQQQQRVFDTAVGFWGYLMRAQPK